MSVQLTNTTFELRITPNKRKRDDLKERKHQQYNYGNNKENHFVFNNFMEVKSIAELIESKNLPHSNSINNCNAFEVVRKPPKKKNRKDISDDGCFVNPALNLDGPEKVVNPFEVKRAAPLPEAVHHCFENTGLNIRGEDRHITNPFEVAREAKAIAVDNSSGIENPCLDVRPAPVQVPIPAPAPPPLAIKVPFTPTLGCRIDFKNIPIEDLTPSSMLNRHLVFSPVKKPEETTPKRPNLSVISEEAVDISKELECYQSEIENSMNEAKATNKRDNKNLMDLKRKSSFAKRLSAVGNDSNLKAKILAENVCTPEIVEAIKVEEHSCHDSSNGQNDCPRSSTPKTPNENCIAKYSIDRSLSINENPDVVYEEVNESHGNMDAQRDDQIDDKMMKIRAEEDSELFKNPAPFVRTYRRDARPRRPLRNREPIDMEPEILMKMDEKSKDSEVFSGIRSSIRKSIRKLIHPHSSSKNKSHEDETPTKEQPLSGSSTNILTTIRHSLRRKQPKQPLATSTPRQSLNDISIIDTDEPRAVYKDTVFSARITHVDENLLRPRTNLRSSFRRSKQAVKSVFKKTTEDYEFKK